MYYQLKKPIKKKKYNKLVDFLIENSDSFLFNLPNMGKTVVNERNADVMDEPIGYVDEEDQDEYRAYVERTKPCIDIIRDDIIESYFDTGCLDQITSIEHQIFYAKISNKTKSFFMQTDSFSKWLFPYLPENPCFIKNGRCIFQCISHEELFFIDLDVPKVEEFLKKNRIRFFPMFGDATPLVYKAKNVL